MYFNYYYHLSNVPGFIDLLNNNLIEKDKGEKKNTKILNKIMCKNQSYCIIKYDKEILSNDLIKIYGVCRSIVVNSKNRILSFAPPKSIPSDEFIKTNHLDTTNVNKLIAEEFIEGTMINVFWDPDVGINGCWEMATKNEVGANTCFFKNYKDNKTFRTMFLEAAIENNLILDLLDKNYSYSFVLQHPFNRIVVPFLKPQLYLIAIYRKFYWIDRLNNDKMSIQIFPIEISQVAKYGLLNTTIKFPTKYEFTSYSDLIKEYASMNTPYYIVGVVIHNTETGERCKIRNPVYEQVKQLRGNQPKIQFQYISLRTQGKVSEFLNFYPEYKKDFSFFRDTVHLFTNTLYANYKECFIKKEKKLSDYSCEYKNHMYEIHKHYLKTKQFITNTFVINYINKLEPQQLMFSLNYQMRKKNIDTIYSDHNSYI